MVGAQTGIAIEPATEVPAEVSHTDQQEHYGGLDPQRAIEVWPCVFGFEEVSFPRCEGPADAGEHQLPRHAVVLAVELNTETAGRRCCYLRGIEMILR